MTTIKLTKLLNTYPPNLVVGYEFKKGQYLVDGLMVKSELRKDNDGSQQWYVILSHEAFDEDDTNTEELNRNETKDKTIKPHTILFWLSLVTMVAYFVFYLLGNQGSELALYSIFIMAMAAYFKTKNP